MGPPLAVPPPGFDDMTVEEQIEFVQKLWDHIAHRAKDVPVPEWQIQELRRRRAEMERTGDRGRPWEDVKRDIEAMLGRRS